MLHELFPRAVAPGQLLNYLHSPKRSNYIGRYVVFWRDDLAARTPAVALWDLLDEVAERKSEIQTALDSIPLRHMSSRLLARGLETVGKTVDAGRLFDWLGLGLDRHGFPQLASETEAQRIRTWLEDNPDLHKAVIAHGLARCVDSEDFDRCMLGVERRLFHVSPPPDLGVWWLNRAKTSSDDSEVRFLLREAVRSLCASRGDEGLSLDLLQSTAEQSPRLRPWLNELLVCRVDLEDPEHARELRARRDEEKANKRSWLNLVQSNVAVIGDGRANPRLLHDLGTAYFGYFVDAEGDTLRERLLDFLNENEPLAQMVLAGFRTTIERDDIPSVEDIVRLFVEGQTYFLARAYLAGISELSREAPDRVLTLSELQITQALAFRLVEDTGEEPAWRRCLLDERPDLVADTLIAFGTAVLRAGREHVNGLYALAYEPAHAAVAQRASLPLLRNFPLRSVNRQLSNLDYLLKAALRHADRNQLIAQIESKVTLRSMTSAQRIRWLAAGFVAVPADFMEVLSDYVSGHQIRVQHLACFLSDRHDQYSVTDFLPIPATALLVRLMGTFVSPYELGESGHLTPTMETADLIARLIGKLESTPDRKATRELEGLLALDDLARWHTAVRAALHRQLSVLREAQFQHPSVDRVSQTLRNLAPANVADLAALTLDYLRDLRVRIRDGNTDDYRQYWELDQLRPAKPRDEEACRDALLSDLQQRLGIVGVDAQPQGRYADRKRADIRVSFGGDAGFNVPIEIKKNESEDLWHAARNQLAPMIQ